MSERITRVEKVHARTSGEIIASDVSWDDYMRLYAADHAEWIERDVIRMSPVTFTHNVLSLLLAKLLSFYLEATDEGELMLEPFVMRLRDISAREPDLQVVLKANAGRRRETYVDGPADLVIEIVSPESDTRDRVEKFAEYERGGVAEYWIIDPLHQEALFYRRESDGVFHRAALAEGIYTCAVLPRLRLPVAWLWREPPVTSAELFDAVDHMLTFAS
jgi:Uma2 family endonuclease